MTDLQKQLQAIKDAIDGLNSIPVEQQSTDEKKLLRDLMSQRARLTLSMIEGSQNTLAAGDHNEVLGAQATKIGGDVQGDLYLGNVYNGPPPANREEGLTIYLRTLTRSCGRITLRGLEAKASDPATAQPLSLSSVYIGLDTTSNKEKDYWKKIVLEKVKSRTFRGQISGPISAIEATLDNRNLVLIGDPGSGKSTFVNHLAYCLGMHHLEPERGYLKHLPGWDTEGGPASMPLIIILRDYVHSLPAKLPKPTVGHLLEFIKTQLGERGLDFFGEQLLERLDAGELFVMFDGLDEVTTDRQRQFVRDVVEQFVDRFPDNRYLVTCRILSYRPPQQDMDGNPLGPDLRLDREFFPVYQLAPFDDAKIDAFIAAWFREITARDIVSSDTARREEPRLQAGVRRKGLVQLASNPLLLTIMALIHTHRGGLPDARVKLYKEAVDLLLGRWEQVKTEDEKGSRIVQQLGAAGMTSLDLEVILRRLAFEAHSQGKKEGSDISYFQLQKAFRQRHPTQDANWASELIETIKLRAGLLLERMPGVFYFPHRTFQEYLAARFLTSGKDFATRAKKLAMEETATWHEVLLLAVGHYVYQEGGIDHPLQLVNRLVPAKENNSVSEWVSYNFAAEILETIGFSRLIQDGWGQELLERLRPRLLDNLTTGRVSDPERLQSGQFLARFGELRSEVVDINRAEFCYVPAGDFLLGEGDDDRDARESEKPQERFNIPYGYWIGRFPVTFGQFRQFMADNGYEDKRWWIIAQKAGLWKNGLYQGKFDGPRNDDEDNQPLRGVSWFEAEAFTRWLTNLWHERGMMPSTWQVTLPSEPEWEKAARGGIEIPERPLVQPIHAIDFDLSIESRSVNPDPGRKYTWLDEPVAPHLAAYDKSGLTEPLPVGGYPDAASVYGCEELLGQVWEWTRSRYEQYPYVEVEKREKLNRKVGERTVLRGGSKWNREDRQQCWARGSVDPNIREVNYGFRIVISPSLPLDAEVTLDSRS